MNRWADVDKRLGLPDDHGLRLIAAERDAQKAGSKNTTILGNNHRVISLFGERQFAREFNLPMDLRQYGPYRGSGRVNFRTKAGPVDVVTARGVPTQRMPDLKIMENAKTVPGLICVLAHFDGKTDHVTLCGFIGDAHARTFPVVTWGRHGARGHVVPFRELEAMCELKARCGVAWTEFDEIPPKAYWTGITSMPKEEKPKQEEQTATTSLLSSRAFWEDH